MALPEETWAEIRVLWCAGTSNSQIARQFEISRAAIDKRAKKEGWQRDLEDDIAQRTQEKLQGLSYGATEAQREQAVDVLSDFRAAMIARHQRDWKHVYALRDDALLILQGKNTRFLKGIMLFNDEGTLVDEKGKPIGQDTLLSRASKLLGMFDKAATALANAQEGERRSHGFDFKSQQENDRAAKQDREAKMGKISAILDALDARKQPKVIEGEVVK